MSISCLILANYKPRVAGRLTSRLAQFGISTFMHVDAKADIGAFKSLVHPATRLVSDRKEVFWAGFSMIEAVIAMARAALSETSSTHFILISDDTYPIKSLSEIQRSVIIDDDLICTWHVPTTHPEYRRIAEVYLPDCRIGYLRGAGVYDRYADSKLVDSLDEVKKVFDKKTAMAFPFKFSKGPNWWSLRRSTLQKCLEIYDSMPEFTDWFKYSAHPDESFFNSIVVNFIDARQKFATPVGSLWDRNPRPYEFGAVEDFPTLREMPQIFARKFSETSKELLDKIDTEILKL